MPNRLIINLMENSISMESSARRLDPRAQIYFQVRKRRKLIIEFLRLGNSLNFILILIEMSKSLKRREKRNLYQKLKGNRGKNLLWRRINVKTA